MRKKLFVCLLLCAVLTLSLGATAFAQSAGVQFVDDSAGLLTQEQAASLNSAAAQVAEEYGCGVYIVTVGDYRDYSQSGVEAAAEAIYSYCGLGLGDDKNGILLLLSMDDRDYDLCAYGSDAHTAFTDYGKSMLAEAFLDDFRDDDWYGGFEDYIQECDTYLYYARQGTPVDIGGADYEELSFGTKLLLSIVPSCIVALVVCLILKAQMKTARLKTEAREYIGKGGVNMRVVQDQFTHRTQTVQVIPRDNDRGGHGGTSINAGGFSHSSGKF